ncbi:hypothetical protein D5S18_32220 [Nocardia panacis]|uniref:Uncharacterized protein n=1 Tax=Nocardia panacis TaxID=2340916 RepID=A0A3A4KAX4_9NOCA|nr:hypothetical protein D5S18_32220 [Nocardia panacis]
MIGRSEKDLRITRVVRIHLRDSAFGAGTDGMPGNRSSAAEFGEISDDPRMVTTRDRSDAAAVPGWVRAGRGRG